MGRANRLLAPRVTAIATTFAGVLDAEPTLAAKATRTGNPVRPAVIAAAATPYRGAGSRTGSLRLLVFGGSQGARIMSDIVPPAIEQLDPLCACASSLVQQAREEDLARVREIYARAERRGRGGAVLRRSAGAHRGRAISWSRAPAPRRWPSLRRSAGPSILVPLPHALDQDQFANAGVLEQARRRASACARTTSRRRGSRPRSAALATRAAKARSNGRSARALAGRARRRRPARRSGAAGGERLRTRARTPA